MDSVNDLQGNGKSAGDECDEDEYEESEDFDEYDDSEACPFCKRKCEPAGAENCEHCFGFEWDGQIMYSTAFDELETAWNRLLKWVEDREDEHMFLMHDCADLAKRERLAIPWIDRARRCDRQYASARDILDSLDVLRNVERSSTGGMLSGSGGLLYVEDVSEVRNVTRDIMAFLAAAEASIQAGEFYLHEGEPYEEPKRRRLDPWMSRLASYPFVVVHVQTAVYGLWVLRFGARTGEHVHVNPCVLDVPFEGEPFNKRGGLRAAAQRTVLEELKRQTALGGRGMCLVLSSKRAIYVTPDGSMAENVPPAGGVHFDIAPAPPATDTAPTR